MHRFGEPRLQEAVTRRALESGWPAALLLVVGAWTAVCLGGALGRWFGADVGMLLGFAAATALVVWARPGGPCLRLSAACAVGAAAGYASYPLWAGTIAALGLAAGLEPAASAAPWPGGPARWLCALVLGPVWEEVLYRERVLGALRARLPAPAALGIASLLFAIPHGDAWSVLGTFVVGLALGALALLGGGIGACIAVHAGLNLAALERGAPP